VHGSGGVHGGGGGSARAGGQPALHGSADGTAAQLPLLIGVHAVSGVNASFARRVVAGVWRSVCAACALRCAFPPVLTHGAQAGSPAVHVPAGTDLAVISLTRNQLPDLDAISLETPAVPHAAAPAAAPDTHSPTRPQPAAPLSPPSDVRAAIVSRFVHFVVDLGNTLGAEPEAWAGAASVPAAASTSSAPAADAVPSAPPDPLTYPWASQPGISGTRMMLRISERAVLALPPITDVCQSKALWRTAWRYAGISNAALPELWRVLAREWPAFFRCEGASTAAANATL
jgi:hypothetical protein